MSNLFAPSYNITTHGFSEWQILRQTGANAWATAQANSVANSAANRLGLVVEDTDANNVKVLKLRSVEVTLTGFAHGLGGGAFGVPIYLSPSSAGAMTTTRPTSDATELVLYLGYTVDTISIYLDPWSYAWLPSEAPEVAAA